MDKRKIKVLFLLKMGHDYACGYSHSSASGLLNSARFVSDMLNRNGIKSKFVQVVDNNDIDREVFNYRPTHCFIEALWVVPEKFDVLKSLHPTVKFIVRIHSDWSFIATEGIAVEWINGYLSRGISVAFNSPNPVRDEKDLHYDWDKKKHIVYLPNYYPPINHPRTSHGRELRVASFGAIRPMKNQLIQAVAAIRYANQHGKDLRFYVNSTRCEQGGSNVLKNVRALFDSNRHLLVEVPWVNNHRYFLDLMSMMDYSLCVSFSETFCITAADAVVCGVPLICSKEVPWASSMSIVDTTDSDAVVERMSALRGIKASIAQHFNRANLFKYSEKSKHLWINYLKGK